MAVEVISGVGACWFMVHVVWGHPRCECLNLSSVSFWLLVVAASNLTYLSIDKPIRG